MTHVRISQGVEDTRKEQCRGMIVIVLSLALLHGTFWKVPCHAMLSVLRDCHLVLLSCCTAQKQTDQGVSMAQQKLMSKSCFLLK